VSLRLRLAAAFALVALLTGISVAVTAPGIIGGGFASLQGDFAGGSGPGLGMGPSSQAMMHWKQVRDETTQTIILVAVLAALGASVLGFLLAGRIAAPLRRLEDAAGAVAGGDLSRRSGLAQRRDEIGSLGRSFDAMAAGLQETDESRRRFLQDAAHELKTPLAVIEATASAVLDGVFDHDRRHLETIREQSRILARVVDDLRVISLAESGDLPLRGERVDVAELVSTVGRSFGARLEMAGVSLAADSPAGPAVTADRDRLAQLLGALLDNAIRYTPAGGRISIETAASPRSVRITVDDSGSGISADALPHVFDRFYQADRARDRASGTSGLGLSIVKALVEAQGGTVGAANGSTGGASIWVELPRAD
jgi:two-component system, OmpR family, sensor histidine kinase BaeS